MADEGSTLTISEQLRLAKDMGYSDDEIMQAISMNCASDGSYRPFSSTNAMVDMLARVQRMYQDAETDNNTKNHRNTDLESNRSSYTLSPSISSSAAIRRAVSFRDNPSSIQKTRDAYTAPFHELSNRATVPQFQLQRLLDAFEKEQKSFNDESTRSIRALEERCRQFADNHAILQVRLLEKDTEIKALKTRLLERADLDEQLRATKAKLEIELLENKSKTDQIRLLGDRAEAVKRQHDLELNDKEKMISDLLAKITTTEDTNRSLSEHVKKLHSDIDDLRQQLASKQADLSKCENYYDEMRKAEQLVEQIRLERDEVRSTLSKIPTCVICLDKRPQMLYMPCSHFICCEGCGGRFEHCPACRQKICGKITVYQ